ncbi:hypothetical protein GOB98_24170 [Sinorhizobium meliloti]|nr:hypothetical protein [Sinorhizobium meliloti]MDW9979123.1 hypothetical protein [Sinorhizobium meliloti]MDX0295711.1 hypothetical protein [Sinorhizobium meliloti]
MRTAEESACGSSLLSPKLSGSPAWKAKAVSSQATGYPDPVSWAKEYKDGLVSHRGLFEQSLQRFASSVPAATIPVELSQAKIVVIAGGSDALWPLDTFAWSILERRQLFGKDAVLISDPEAGHRVLLPGETTSRSSLHACGGCDVADARLGQASWASMTTLLG